MLQRLLLATYKEIWRPLVPMAGMGLVIFVLWSYAFYMRYLVVPRWCKVLNDDDNDNSSQECNWMRVHDVMVMYWGTMILFHYASTVFRSPGVVLPVSSNNRKQKHIKWSFWKGQGGILGLNAVCRPARERQRVAYYGKLHDASNDARSNNNNNNESNDEKTGRTIQIPSLQSTYCQQCQQFRPPRCRHCSTCQRCVLQYDHHCVWVNQCIGYNNYRNFVLMLFYLTAGCWYGVFLLLFPFVEPLYQQIVNQGSFLAYWKANYFMLIPAPLELLRLVMGSECSSVRNMDDLITSIAYPLMLFVGTILLFFLASHLRMAAQGRTTLEDNMIHQGYATQNQYQYPISRSISSSVSSLSFSSSDTTKITIVNPFDQGSAMKNLQQILGCNYLYWFLPIPVDPTLPYLPPKAKNG